MVDHRRDDFQTIADHVAPTWPESATNAEHCLVFADPAGHPFCLTTWDDMPS